MLKQTVQLFVKALVIGLLINLILHQAPAMTVSPTADKSPLESQPSLAAPTAKTLSDSVE